ncbi:MAG: Na/Pi cotransporter family protein [Tannerella sp.]|jgi:phosphate:Na+ symporter|nr:Na/Pi cotransporter family protein [Tannerella sp.]
MDYSFLEFLTLIGALGMFLYGMKIMSEGLQKVAGDKLRSILSVMTSNRVAGVFTGLFITALIQSSSATTVMVVSFVNAGLLNLSQAISVIMGANVGTTVTAWIISIFGFKVDISTLALPLIGICIPFIFSSNNKRKPWGEFLIGFALLFLGLAYLKDSVPDLQKNPEVLSFIQNYTSMGYTSILLFLLIGGLLTVVVQSSSATVAITLIMCTKGWIPFEMAAAMVLGENIGTTITANIAAIKANIQARRAALAHFMFNIFGVCWMLFLFHPFTNMISWIVTNYGPGNPAGLTSFLSTLSPETIELITSGRDLTDPGLIALQDKVTSLQVSVSYGLSLFHTLFNIANICVMIGFVNLYVKICSLVIKSKKDQQEEEFQLKFISAGILSTSEMSLLQAKQEIALYGKRVHRMFNMVKELYYEKDIDKFLKTFARIEKYEQISDRMEIEIANYLTKVMEGHLSAYGKENIRIMLRVITEIESVADACNNLAKAIKRRNDGKSVFLDSQNHNIDRMFALDDKALIRMNELLDMPEQEITNDDMGLSLNIETEINNYRNQLKNDNMENIDAKKYNYTDGVFYMDIVSESERLGDYVINVVQSVVKIKN